MIGVEFLRRLIDSRPCLFCGFLILKRDEQLSSLSQSSLVWVWLVQLPSKKFEGTRERSKRERGYIRSPDNW